MIPSLVLGMLGLARAQSPEEGEATEPDAAPPAEVTPAPAPAGTVPAEEAPEELTPAGDVLTRYRQPFEAIAERAIGTASVPIRFDWRRTNVHLAATGSFLFELNNFDSVRGGVMARLPTGGVLWSFELSYVGVWDTPSSRLLSLTPYRQPGRPQRMELDVMLGLPLAEGVVTAFPRFFPAVEMVFTGYAGLRYLIYPWGWGHMKPREVAGALLSPALTSIEIDNLDDRRLASMQVDLGRYGLMLGFGNDLYFKPGLFLSPRALFAVPILAPASQTELLFWADLSLAIGVAL